MDNRFSFGDDLVGDIADNMNQVFLSTSVGRDERGAHMKKPCSVFYVQ
jgi:hypothetical protein